MIKTEATMEPAGTLAPEAVSGTARPRRVLYVEQNVDGTTGGSYRSLLFLLNGLDAREYDRIVCFYREHELLDDYKAAGCRTMVLWYPKSFEFARRIRAKGPLGRVAWPFAALLQKVLNVGVTSAALFLRNLWLLIKLRIDVLHLNNGVTVGHEFLLAAKLLGLKVIIHQRGIDPVPQWAAKLSSHADHVICVSDAARQHLIDHGMPAERITAIHNGINFDALRRQIKRDPATVRASIGLAADAPIVGLAGMIRPWKGQMVLVKAMLRLRRNWPGVKAVIMGGVSDSDPRDVVYYEEIKAFIREHQLEDSILLLEYQPNAPEFLQTFDVMVHTATDPEPFSRVVIEGMALERAIVASWTGGTPEAIDDGVSGFLVPPGDADALAEKVERLLADPALRRTIGQGAREKVERRFLIQGHIARTRAVYDSLFTRKRA